MTPYEMFDLSQSNYSTMTAFVSAFTALLSAYLVAAYFVGGRLSKTQHLLANSLYLILQTLNIVTIYNFSSTARYWGIRGRLDMPISSGSVNLYYIPEAIALILFVTTLLSVWFMWKTRRLNSLERGLYEDLPHNKL